MRPLHLRIIATGLMSACAIVVIRRALVPDHFMDTVGTAPHVMGRRGPVMETGPSGPRAGRMAVREGHVRSLAGMPSGERHRPAPVVAAAGPVGDANGRATSKKVTETAPADVAGPIGIQLGQDVRLPAALMIQSGSGFPVDGSRVVSPEIAAAREEIANSFYRELADHALSEPKTPEKAAADPQDGPAETPDAGETVVITPGTPIEDALTRADEIYRALYGDEACNRHSIGSAIEVMLPAGAGGGVK